MTTDETSSLGSTASRRPQHSRRHNAIVNSNVEVSCVGVVSLLVNVDRHTEPVEVHFFQANRTKLQEPEVFTSNVNVAKSEPPLTMPAFALGNPVVDVSLSSSTSSVVSGSASQHFQQTPAVDDSASAAVKPGSQAAKSKPFDTGPPAGRPTPVVQQLNHTDTVKWSQVAAWAAGDSAQAAALVEHLGPCIAESVASEADQDHALLRLEVQVARKKLVRPATQHESQLCLCY